MKTKLLLLFLIGLYCIEIYSQKYDYIWVVESGKLVKE